MSEQPAGAENSLRPSWFELFYDLVIVAALVSVNDSFLGNPGLITALTASAAAAALFTVWLMTALVNNRLPGDSAGRRLLMVAQMAGVVVAALAVDQEAGLRNDYGLIAYGFALICGGLMYAWDGPGRPSRWRSERTSASTMTGAGLIAIVGSAVPDAWIWLVLTTSILVAVVPATLRWSREERLRPVAVDYLGERMGLFVLIVLGLSFGQLVVALNGSDSIPDVRFFILMFVLMFTTWWMYFGLGVPSHPLLNNRGRVLWILAHYLLMIGIASLGDVVAALSAQSQGDPLNDGAAYLGIGLALVLVGFAVLVATLDGLGRAAMSLLIVMSVVLVAYGLIVDLEDSQDLRVVTLAGASFLVASAFVLAWLRRRALGRTGP